MVKYYIENRKLAIKSNEYQLNTSGKHNVTLEKEKKKKTGCDAKRLVYVEN